LLERHFGLRVIDAKEALEGAMDHKAACRVAAKAYFKLFAETINAGSQANRRQEIDSIDWERHRSSFSEREIYMFL
jgi:hypothetical protein